MDLQHIKLKFIDEAENLLTNLDNILIDLEKEPANAQFIGEAFRVMHTIKGASGMFGFEKIVEITHEVETLYDLVRNGQMTVSSQLIELTFGTSDHIRALLKDEQFAGSQNIDNHNTLVQNINAFKKDIHVPTKILSKAEENIKPLTKIATWNILFYPNDEIIRRAVNLIYTFQDLFALGEYKIHHLPFKSIEEQFWNIFLVTDQPFEEIENALMFILEYCKINKIADFNIFDPQAIIQRKNEVKTIEENYKVQESEPGTKPVVIQNLNSPRNNNTEIGKTTTTRINVEASKLDTLMYLVSELVTTKSELLLALQKNNEIRALESAEKIEKLSKLFSENALSIRLVSLQEMLNKFKRLVRDLSKQLDKNIIFEIHGEETELDKNIIDALGEPLMHIIRNNIDHGIESPEKRIASGKSETGTIRFEAQKTGNYVFLSISDDGNGIDTELIYNKAIEKGFIAEGTQLNKKEILELIFLPGFSTAQSLSNISGRGVGMDIVIKKIKDIRGEIYIDTEKNKGTKFTIKVQQTISIIDTLLVKTGMNTYAIPVEDIEVCILEPHGTTGKLQNNLAAYKNDLIPYIHLKNFSLAEENPENEKLIIINRRDKRYAIVTDSIIGEYQVVIKPLGETFNAVKFISGASLLGDGSIALLIDTDKLYYEISGIGTN